MRKTAAAILFVFLCVPALAGAAGPSLAIVFPLEGPAGPTDLQWLGEGIAVSLSGQLRNGELASMDRSDRIRLVESLDLPPGAQLSRGSMIRVGQQAGADYVVMGSYSGSEKSLRVAVRVLEVKTLKLSGEMVANGSLSTLPQMENELAWLILRNNGFGKATSRRQFQERIRKVPNSAYAFYVESLNSPSDTEQIQLLRRAVQAHQDFPEAQFALGRLYFSRKDCATAMPHLLLGQNGTNRQTESDFMRSTCRVEQNEPLDAIEPLTQLAQSSRSFAVLNNLGVAYLRKGDTDQGLKYILEAQTLAPTDATAALNLALIYYVQGNHAASMAVLEPACSAHPKNGMLEFLMGVVLKARNENPRAEEATGEARKLGIKVDRLEAEDPRGWSRVIFSLDDFSQ